MQTSLTSKRQHSTSLPEVLLWLQMPTLRTQEAGWKFREFTPPGEVLNHSPMRFGARVFLRLTHTSGGITVKHVFYGGFQGCLSGIKF